MTMNKCQQHLKYSVWMNLPLRSVQKVIVKNKMENALIFKKLLCMRTGSKKSGYTKEASKGHYFQFIASSLTLKLVKLRQAQQG